MRQWYYKYFCLYPDGACRQCGTPTDKTFCDTKCEVIWNKDNNIAEIKKLRTKLVAYHRFCKAEKDTVKRNIKLAKADQMAKELAIMIENVKLSTE